MVCLDTSFIVDILRGNQKAKRVLDELRATNDTTSIAAPTLMELQTSIALDQGITNEQDLLDRIKNTSVILHLDDESATRAGRIEAALILAGETISAVDIMIGAIALQHDEVILTRNARHFTRISGLEVRTY